jgi:hypothetical protein
MGGRRGLQQRTFVQGRSSPRNGRHPHSRCNWPKLVAWGPCAWDAIFRSGRALASLWLPQIALMYSITTSVQLNFPLAAVPPHLLLACPSPLEVSQSLKESWLARPGQTPISRETLVELFERDILRTSLTGAFYVANLELTALWRYTIRGIRNFEGRICCIGPWTANSFVPQLTSEASSPPTSVAADGHLLRGGRVPNRHGMLPPLTAN